MEATVVDVLELQEGSYEVEPSTVQVVRVCTTLVIKILNH